jgi:hypothetical protein
VGALTKGPAPPSVCYQRHVAQPHWQVVSGRAVDVVKVTPSVQRDGHSHAVAAALHHPGEDDGEKAQLNEAKAEAEAVEASTGAAAV